MYFIQPDHHTRRAFLRRAGQLAFTGAALPTVLNLAAMGEAAAFDATDYKALVCVFMYGGNDYANTVVNYDAANYERYNKIRGAIAIPRAELAATLLNPTTPLPGGEQYALNQAMTGLAGLFNKGAAAVQLNVGPLVAPLTLTEFKNGSVPRPPKIGSHNDHQSIWQSYEPEGARYGWGGRLGDLALGGNGQSSILTCLTAGDSSVFLSGEQAFSYKIGPSGPVKISSLNSDVYGSSGVRAAMAALALQERSQLMEKEYARMTARAFSTEGMISGAFDSAPADLPIFASFAGVNGGLASQLKTVARMIAARKHTGVKRQVFLVSMGAFDMHAEMIKNQPLRVGAVSDAMTAFYEATEAMGVADKVTAFTASEFGRSLQPNRTGSDHGWGSHHMVVGGAVKGKAFYGKAPPVTVTQSADAYDQWHIGGGRLLPTTSVDQYIATMGKWFGVQGNEMAGIAPNLNNFGGTYPKDLGFMR